MRHITLLFFYILIVAISSSCHRSYFKEVSKKVDYMSRSGRKVSGLTFHDARLHAYEAHKRELDGIFSRDTLFILEQYDIETGQFWSTFWNEDQSISFKEDRGKTTVIESPFDGHTKGFIQRWDTAGIRQQERLHSDVLPMSYNYASRVSKKGKSFQVDTIAFRRFVILN